MRVVVPYHGHDVLNGFGERALFMLLYEMKHIPSRATGETIVQPFVIVEMHGRVAVVVEGTETLVGMTSTSLFVHIHVFTNNLRE